MVLALSGGEVFWLFTGDIAQAQEKKVVEKLGQYAAFVEGKQKYLKAAHHGSKYSNSAQILQYFTGGTAVISCGRGNRYGHPHAEALFRMEEADISPVLTWESSAVARRQALPVECVLKRGGGVAVKIGRMGVFRFDGESSEM